MTVTVGTSSIFHSGDHLTGKYTPGSYVVEVRAWADNAYDTNTFEELLVEIVDPCLLATLTIDNSVFKDLPGVSLTQFINYAAL